ncbi:MAG: SRPBCC family protein [Methylococcales bacterium]|jgi:mxaD protein|nr:SRPBCC family protein [Methylococcales bacterium]
MKKILLPFATALLLFTGLANAHGPVRQDTEESITINAPAEKVWGLIKEFGDIATWHSDVFTSPAEGGNLKGGKRVLTLKDGNTVNEELKNYNEDKMSYSYKITGMTTVKTINYAGNEEKVPAIPVDNFSATITVTPKGDNSEVTWKAGYYRAYMNNNPPEEMNEATANAAVKAFVSTGLIDLKKLAEK